MNVKTAAVVLLAGASALLARGGDPLDDSLIFDLALLGDANADGVVSDTELTDALRFSASAKPVTKVTNGYAVTAEGYTPLCWTNLPTFKPVFGDVTNTEASIWFPQHFKVDADGSYKMSDSVVDIDAPAGGSDEATVFVRFYWAGVQPELLPFQQRGSLAMYKWDWTKAAGWTFILNRNANKGESYLSVGPGKRNVIVSDAVIKSNTWYDAIVTIAPNPANEAQSIVRGWLVTPPTKSDTPPVVKFKEAISEQRLVYEDATNQKLRLGAEYAGSLYKWDDATDGNAGSTKSFRGAVRHVRIWDRALSEQEVMSVFAGYFGRKWAVGAANGSSDEFAAETDAPVETFDPQTMPWRQMRRELTAEHPTLTLKSGMTAMEVDKPSPQILTIHPVFGDGVPVSSRSVEISVNGTSVGVFDLGTMEGRNAFIPAKYWTRDADGQVTVAVTRTGTVTGTIGIDALELGGTWQVGKDDNQNADMSKESWSKDRYFAGDGNSLHFRRAVLGGADNQRSDATNTYFHVSVPDEVAKAHAFRFSTKIISQGGSGGMSDLAKVAQPLMLRLNGKEIWRTGGVPNGTYVEVDLPAGSLIAGLNRFELVNLADSAAGFTDYCWANVDFMRLEVKRLPRGMLLIFR